VWPWIFPSGPSAAALLPELSSVGIGEAWCTRVVIAQWLPPGTATVVLVEGASDREAVVSLARRSDIKKRH
jgi:hypothetical protein